MFLGIFKIWHFGLRAAAPGRFEISKARTRPWIIELETLQDTIQKSQPQVNESYLPTDCPPPCVNKIFRVCWLRCLRCILYGSYL